MSEGLFMVEDVVNVRCRTFSTLTVRLARLVVNAYLENVDLVVRTIGEYGEEAEQGPKAS